MAAEQQLLSALEAGGLNLAPPPAEVTDPRPFDPSLISGAGSFSALTEAIGCAIFIIQGYRIVYLNREAELLCGTTSKSVRGMSIQEIFRHLSPECFDGLLPVVGRIARGLPFPPSLELKLIREDGVTLWVEVRVKALDYAGKPALLACVLDVTERKLAEQALRESERRFHNVADSTMDGIISSTDGQIIYWNKAAERIFGYRGEEVLNRPVSVLMPERYRELYLAGYGHFLKNGEAPLMNQLSTLSGRKKDGSEFLLEMYLSGWTEGDHTYFTATARDVTERKKAEEELIRARQDLEQRVQERTSELEDAKRQAELYVDLMGHDISNLNQIAMGYLELSLDRLSLSEADRELISKPLEALRNSSRLIDNVRKLQRIRTDPSRLTLVDLGQILEAVHAEYSALANSSVLISYRPVTGSKVLANDLLRDVFSNLIGNAIKHSAGSKAAEPPVIRIELTSLGEASEKYYLVSVEDNGPGIRDDYKTLIFDRLQRGPTRAKGSGLGLHLVKSLVEGFDGEVWVEDRVKGDSGQGSRFLVKLPAAD